MNRARASEALDGRRGEALVAVLERAGVELRRAGRELRALCPFHGEKTPSFYANPDKGAYYCQGCGAKGDAITFVQETRSLGFLEARDAVLAELGETHEPRPPRPAAVPEKIAASEWVRLADHDTEAEDYLCGRGLFHRDPDVLRFNVGTSANPWLDARAREGYRVAFAVRRPSGLVQTISLRHVGPGEPPLRDGRREKTLSLFGCSTKGAAILSPAVEQLAAADPEFARDRILVLEGGTDWLGAAALFGQSTTDYGALPTWPLAAIGKGQAASAVEAFGAVVRWRAVFVGLDADVSREDVARVEQAARKAGARSVSRLEPIRGAKDWADVARGEYAS